MLFAFAMATQLALIAHLTFFLQNQDETSNELLFELHISHDVIIVAEFKLKLKLQDEKQQQQYTI